MNNREIAEEIMGKNLFSSVQLDQRDAIEKALDEKDLDVNRAELQTGKVLAERSKLLFQNLTLRGALENIKKSLRSALDNQFIIDNAVKHAYQLAEQHLQEPHPMPGILRLAKEARVVCKQLRDYYEDEIAIHGHTWDEFIKSQYLHGLDLDGLEATLRVAEALNPAEQAILEGWSDA